MTIWAIGALGGRARCYVETTDFAHIAAQVQGSEEVAPVTKAQKEIGVVMLGDMAVEDSPEDAEL